MYFIPQLQGKVIQQSDILSVRGMNHEAMVWQEKTGRVMLWTNSMFGGMPTYQMSSPQKNNMVKAIDKFHQAFISRPIGYFFAAMLGIYIVLLCLGAGHWAAMLGAVAFGFTTNQISLYETGHMSKFMTIVYSAYLFGGTILAYQKKYTAGGVLFALGMALSLYNNHIQMTYYLGLFLLLYVLIAFGFAISKKELPAFIRGSAVLLIGLLLSIGASASKLWTTIEYSAETMRGKPVLETPLSNADPASAGEDGLEWDYAMQWSNGPEDVLGMLIPRAAGGSGSERLSSNSAVMKDLKKKGLTKEIPVPLYYGALPFTAGPAYVGASVLFLFIFSLFYIRRSIRYWLIGIVILTILLSMGKHFAILNKLLFDYLPLYSKFRAPSSILSVTALLIPLGAALGLGGFMKGHEKSFQRPIWIAFGIVGGLCLLVALFGSALMSFGAPSDTRLAEAGWDVNALIADRKSALSADAWRSFIWVALCSGVIWVYHQGKIKQWLLLSGLGLIIIADLWAVGRRYISSDDFVEARNVEAIFEPREVDKQILADPDLHYRVHDITTNPFNSSMASYHHRTLGGYSPAKLQRIQDLIDRYIANGNMNVASMLNTKYFIFNDQQGNPVAQKNDSALGNAWFIETIKVVDTNREELEALDSVDLRLTAFVNKEFEDQVKGFDPVKTGTITLTSYAPDELKYSSTSTGDQLAVFSEIYYGPNKGWQAYIDGVKAPHFRADYALRAMNVPSGDHEIVFRFEPKSYRIGEILSLIFSLLIIAILVFGLYKWLTKAEPTTPVAIADLSNKKGLAEGQEGKKLLRKKKKP
jgi:hypothetical protein